MCFHQHILSNEYFHRKRASVTPVYEWLNPISGEVVPGGCHPPNGVCQCFDLRHAIPHCVSGSDRKSSFYFSSYRLFFILRSVRYVWLQNKYTLQIYYYVFHGRVTLFFANNFLMQCRITMKFLHNFFKPWSIFKFTYHVYWYFHKGVYSCKYCYLKPWHRNRTLSILQDGCQCLLRTR